MRTERDSLGTMEVPDDAYFGAQTARALQNFPISGRPMPQGVLRALALIKRAAAEVNAELGLVDAQIAQAIAKAADEVSQGELAREFAVDVFQTGSGTSTNMNMNEVLANRAAEILGKPRGSKQVHPNDHVNRCQSSNDVVPTAIQLAALLALKQKLDPALAALGQALAEKAQDFMPIIKTGRTHLQDATPIRLGQVFLGYAGQIERARRRLSYAAQELAEVPLGGTAVGTGIGAHPQFAARVCARLSASAGVSVRETDNHFQAQASLDAVVFASGAVRTAAVALMKIANDLRWLGSGPRAGLGELELPAVQPGSSIMPGKVNPVIAESVMMVCARVLGNDVTCALSNTHANFELCTMMPGMALALLESIEWLATSAQNLATQCVAGLRVTDRGPKLVEQGLMLATALAPIVGYDQAAEIAKEAAKSNRSIRDVARERTSLAEAELARILDPGRLTEPGLEGAGGG